MARKNLKKDSSEKETSRNNDYNKESLEHDISGN